MAQMNEQNKTPEKELNETAIKFKKLVTRMLTKELTEYGKNIKEEMKVTLSEIKKDLRGTNSGEDEA